MNEQEIINAISKVSGLSGMTVNERLYACDLFEEYDNALLTDKLKARKILELLGVDKFSIEQAILNTPNLKSQILKDFEKIKNEIPKIKDLAKRDSEALKDEISRIQDAAKQDIAKIKKDWNQED